MRAFESFERRLRYIRLIACRLNRFEKRIEIIHDERRVRLARRAEIFFDADMHLNIPRLKPRASALRKFGGFWNLNKTENANIKCPRVFFSAFGHCQLNMINGEDGHCFCRTRLTLSYGSTGYPALIHASRPPSNASTCVYPLCNMRNAARALVCSFGQVQYVMIHWSLSRFTPPMLISNSSSGMDNAPTT